MAKQKLIILVGLPSSGKTTYAKEYLRRNPNVAIVSSDRIRNDIDELNIKIQNETKIFKEMRHRVRKSLKFGRDVIVNATNLKIKYRKVFIDLGKEFGATVEIHMVVTPFDVCCEREIKRFGLSEESACDKVIKTMGEFQLPLITEGVDKILYHLDDRMEKRDENDVGIPYLPIYQEVEFRGIKCRFLCEAASMLIEQRGGNEIEQIASFLGLYGRILTKDQDYAQIGAYLLLVNLLSYPKISSEMKDKWLEIIRLVNYFTLTLNWSSKYNKLFSPFEINSFKDIKNAIFEITSNEDMQKIRGDYYAKKIS